MLNVKFFAGPAVSNFSPTSATRQIFFGPRQIFGARRAPVSNSVQQRQRFPSDRVKFPAPGGPLVSNFTQQRQSFFRTASESHTTSAEACGMVSIVSTPARSWWPAADEQNLSKFSHAQRSPIRARFEPQGSERERGATGSSLCLKLGQFEPWAAGRDGWVSGGWLGWQKLPKPACRCLFQPEACPLLVLIPFSHSSFLSSPR